MPKLHIFPFPLLGKGGRRVGAAGGRTHLSEGARRSRAVSRGTWRSLPHLKAKQKPRHQQSVKRDRVVRMEHEY